MFEAYAIYYLHINQLPLKRLQFLLIDDKCMQLHDIPI